MQRISLDSKDVFEIETDNSSEQPDKDKALEDIMESCFSIELKSGDKEKLSERFTFSNECAFDNTIKMLDEMK
jgi:hypothetical protein